MAAPTRDRTGDGGDTRLGRDDTRPLEADTSLGDLVARLGRDLGDLMSTQVELAKVELRDEARSTAKAGGMLAAGAVTGLIAAVFALLTVALVLDVWMPRWAAFLIVTAVVAIVAGVLVVAGRRRMTDVSDPMPRTRETVRDDMTLPRDLKEDLSWTAPRRT